MTKQVEHHVAHFAAEDALYACLARLNEDGHQPEMGCIDSHGIAFLATLTDPDADCVHYILADHDGRAHQVNEWCDNRCQCSWRARYPVVALSRRTTVAEQQAEDSSKGPRPMRVFLSPLTGRAYATNDYDDAGSLRGFVANSKHDVTDDVVRDLMAMAWARGWNECNAADVGAAPPNPYRLGQEADRV